MANICFDTIKEPVDLFLENGLAGSSVGIYGKYDIDELSTGS